MFPEKTRILKRNKGWEDRGEVDGLDRADGSGMLVTSLESCNFCRRIVHIGIEKDKLFKFCPRCLVKKGLNKLNN